MGAYLSQAKTDKESTDECNDYVEVGASSMQGWRNSQEDAHNSILNYDVNASLFAVYDGHGGAEVSTYCAQKFPAFLKSLASYNEGNYEQALKDAFLGFDITLLDPDIIDVLKVIAADKNTSQAEDIDPMEEDDGENLLELHEEGTLPLAEVLEKYKGRPSTSGLKQSKSKTFISKPVSPYIRGRRAAAIIADATNKAVLDSAYKPGGSSTSKVALLGSNTAEVAKLPTEEPESSSSIKLKEHIDLITDNKNDNNAEAEAKASPSFASHIESTKASNGTANINTIKESEQNGSVSSSIPREQYFNTDIEISNNNKDDSIKNVDISAINSNEVHSESKQNGDAIKVNSAKRLSDVDCDIETNDAAISSTSLQKEEKAIIMDSSSEDDADFDARQVLEYSGDDEEEAEEEDDEDDKDDLKGEVDSDESDDAGYDEDEDSGDEEDDGEDEESMLANENFCANMIEEPGKDSGCTAVVALLVGRDLYVANAGDSRCVVCRNGIAIEMSLDHKPEDAEEFDRIVKAGGRVTLDGRVNGGLNLSRALGDHGYKMNYELPAEEQMISAMPDIKKLIISPEDEFMVLACDGIWNFMSSEEVVAFVRLRLKDETKKTSKICEELFEACLAPNTMGDGTGCDNMTAVIIRFKPPILKLPTKIDPTETEDVVVMKVTDATKSPVHDNCKNANKDIPIEVEQSKAQKRAAASAIYQEGNEASAQKEITDIKYDAKRMKMDDSGVNNININNSTPASNLAGGSTLSSSFSSLSSASSSYTLLQNSSVDESSNNINEAQASSPAPSAPTEEIAST